MGLLFNLGNALFGGDKLMAPGGTLGPNGFKPPTFMQRGLSGTLFDPDRATRSALDATHPHSLASGIGGVLSALGDMQPEAPKIAPMQAAPQGPALSDILKMQQMQRVPQLPFSIFPPFGQ